MKLSSHELLPLKVINLQMGAQTAQVELKIQEGSELSLSLSLADLSSLDLTEGQNVYIIFNDPNVLLASDNPGI